MNARRFFSSAVNKKRELSDVAVFGGAITFYTAIIGLLAVGVKQLNLREEKERRQKEMAGIFFTKYTSYYLKEPTKVIRPR